MQVAELKRTWNLAPLLQIVQKIPENYCACLDLYQSTKFGDLMGCGSKIQPVSCTNIHYDVTDLVN